MTQADDDAPDAPDAPDRKVTEATPDEAPKGDGNAEAAKGGAEVIEIEGGDAGLVETPEQKPKSTRSRKKPEQPKDDSQGEPAAQS